MKNKVVLLVNLGTPDSPSLKDVRKYLKEFLMDERVIDINPFLRTCLVKGIIVPFRSPRSSKVYAEIWDKEYGSPLKHYSKLQQQLLQSELGDGYVVELAMRYQNPSIRSVLNRLKGEMIASIQVIAVFPQYASATVGSIYREVMEGLGDWAFVPPLSFKTSFYDAPLMIESFAENGEKHVPENYDHILFSFHGLPERQLIKCDTTGNYCTKVKDCCRSVNNLNETCYSAQAHQTAILIAERLKISKSRYTICFQSRLGNTAWIQPYTSEVLKQLAAQGKKRVLIYCPSFVSDCLETLYEIGVEYNKLFQQAGGDYLQLVESLNDSPTWIKALKEMID